MSDKLEKYIRDHRADFDVKEPSAGLWDKIEGQLNPESKIIPSSRSLVFWRVAAAVLFLTTTALIIDKFINTRNEPTAVAVISNPVLLEAEGYYLNLIDQKILEISTYEDSGLTDPQFLNDLNRLDSVYQMLKTKIPNGNEQSIVDAMIQNLQLRIDVLTRQLEIIQSIENTKRENNESINI